MPSIQINNETLTFNNIYYVDSVNGNDSTGDGSESSPFKTIQKAINSASSGDALYIRLGTYTGAVSGAGLVSVNKDLAFIGEYVHGEIPVIHSTDCNCIQVAAGVTTEFYRLKIMSSGSCSGGGENAYATLLNMKATCTASFYNCIFVPRGVCFVYVRGSLSIWNSVIDYSSHVFQAEVNLYSTVAAQFNNCVEMGTYTCRTSGAPTPFEFHYSIYSGQKSFSNYNGTCILVSDIQMDNIYKILNTDWRNLGTGSNPDGSVAHIGVYGGTFAWLLIEIQDLSISPTHMWYEDTDIITLTGEIVNVSQAQYKVLAGGSQVYPSEGFTPLQDCPASISAPINKQDLLNSGGELTVIISDGITGVSSQVLITIEDIDTLAFNRTREPVDWVLSDTTNTEFTEEGFKFKECSEGEFYAHTNNSGQIKTKGKRTISQVTVDCSDDTSQVVENTYDMQYPVVVGEGKMFGFNLDLSKNIVGIQVREKV